MARKPITTKETRAAKNLNTSMGQVLGYNNVPGPGHPMTSLYANEDYT